MEKALQGSSTFLTLPVFLDSVLSVSVWAAP